MRSFSKERKVESEAFKKKREEQNVMREKKKQ